MSEGKCFHRNMHSERRINDSFDILHMLYKCYVIEFPDQPQVILFSGVTTRNGKKKDTTENRKGTGGEEMVEKQCKHAIEQKRWKRTLFSNAGK